MKNILYATDMNPFSAHVLAYAVDIAQRCDGGITVVHALGAASSWQKLSEQQAFRREMIRKLEAMVAVDLQACEQGGRARILAVCVEFGSAAEVILRMSREEQADLVVMGSHGYPAERRTLGAVLKPVLNTCRVPVVVVPMPKSLSVSGWRPLGLVPTAGAL